LRTGLKLTQEHVIPVSRGGGTTAENIVPACGKCNSSKKDRGILVMLPITTRGWPSRTEEQPRSPGLLFVSCP
jgi:5-methylcytosine-specific restriction endonuclease McrA